jgi:predicted nucleotide-binding protein
VAFCDGLKVHNYDTLVCYWRRGDRCLRHSQRGYRQPSRQKIGTEAISRSRGVCCRYSVGNLLYCRNDAKRHPLATLMARKPVLYRPKGPLLSPDQGRIQLQEAVRRGNNLLNLQPLPEERYDVWSHTSIAVLKAACGHDSPHLSTFVGERRVTIGSVPEQYAEPQRRTELERRIRLLEAIIDELPAAPQLEVPNMKVGAVINRKVFVVHGHQHGARDTVARFLEKLELEPVILDEEANRGRTVIEKFLDHSDVAFAIVLVIGDDVGGVKGSDPTALRPRARQNVIFELGYFVGKLERERVCALYEPEVEMPTDFGGVGYVKFDREGNWQLLLAKELNAAGIKVDMNAALFG